MRRSKRKVDSKYGSPIALSKPQVKKGPLDMLFTQSDSMSRDESIFHRLLDVLLLRMIPHVWMKIVSTTSIDVETISFSMCQSWDLVENLLIKLGYLLKYGNDVRLNIIKIENLAHKTVFGSSFQIGNTKIGNKKVYYICCDKPIYTYPFQQNSSAFTFGNKRHKFCTDMVVTNLLKELPNTTSGILMEFNTSFDCKCNPSRNTVDKSSQEEVVTPTPTVEKISPIDHL